MKKRPEEANLKEDAWKDYENAGKGQENENDPREALFGGTERERLEVVVFDRNDWKRQKYGNDQTTFRERLDAI